MNDTDRATYEATISSLRTIINEHEMHHERREKELRLKIRELRADVHEWQERYVNAIEFAHKHSITEKTQHTNNNEFVRIK